MEHLKYHREIRNPKNLPKLEVALTVQAERIKDETMQKFNINLNLAEENQNCEYKDILQIPLMSSSEHLRSSQT